LLRYLGARPFAWQMTINNLAFICNTGAPDEYLQRFEFGQDASQDLSVGQKRESTV
jgi:hypothetical protein